MDSQKDSLKRKARSSSDDLLGCLLAPYLSHMEVPANFGLNFKFMRDNMSDIKKNTSLNVTYYTKANIKRYDTHNVLMQARLVQNELYILNLLPKTEARDAKNMNCIWNSRSLKHAIWISSAPLLARHHHQA